jgi:hypothetical protein
MTGHAMRQQCDNCPIDKGDNRTRPARRTRSTKELNMNTVKRVFAPLAALTLAIGAMVGVTTGTAQAAPYSAPYIRMMDWNRYDLLMESETNSIARDPGKAAWARKEVIAGPGLVGGLLGAWAASTMCIPAVTVCAAQASTAGKWGGMTFTVLPPNFWCWKY